jgi:hypothetical protein
VFPLSRHPIESSAIVKHLLSQQLARSATVSALQLAEAEAAAMD